MSVNSSAMSTPTSRRSGNGGESPSWSQDGIVCTGESYKQLVKLTFARGASIKDPMNLFNSSLEGNTRRAIDLREGEKINDAAFKQLIRAAVAANSQRELNGPRRSKPGSHGHDVRTALCSRRELSDVGRMAELVSALPRLTLRTRAGDRGPPASFSGTSAGEQGSRRLPSFQPAAR